MRNPLRLLSLLIALVSAQFSTLRAEDSATSIRDVVYGHKYGMALTYDVLRPEKANGAALLFMMSGGWRSRWAPPERTIPRFREYIDAGFTVIPVWHGSSPKFDIPEIVPDVRRAVRFTRTHAADYGIDPARIGVFGGSAGGHLSLMLGTTGDDGTPDAKDPIDRASSRVAAVVAYFAPVDLRNVTPKVGDDGELVGGSRRFPALNFHPSKAEAHSPLLQVSSDDAPSLMIHGDKDRLVPLEASKLIHAAFREKNVETDLLVLEGAGHGFRGEARKRSTQATLAWFTKHLLAPKAALERAEPESVGLSSGALAKIKPAMQKLVDANAAAGVISVVARDGKIVHFEQVGSMDVAAKKSMRADTIFRIYSMSKPIVSAAALSLWEEGRLDLDDPVAKHVPRLEGLKVQDGDELVDAKRAMTVRDLLRHTAGLTYGFFSNFPVDLEYRSANILDDKSSLEVMAGKLSKIPLLYHPGERWHYSIAVDVLGHVVEKAAGEPLDRVLEKRIFLPLGMKDTGFHVPEDKLERFAANYGPDGKGSLRVIDAPASSRYGRPATFFSGGGGLVSTAMDYMRFAQMLLGRGKLGNVRVLKQATVAEMTRNQLPDKLVPIKMSAPLRGTGFGLGVSVRVKTSDHEHAGVLGEYGWGGAASTSFWVSPAERLIGLTLTQYMPYSGRVPAAFKPLVYGAIKAE